MWGAGRSGSIPNPPSTQKLKGGGGENPIQLVTFLIT